MKIKGEKFDTMKRAITALVEKMGGAKEVRAFYERTLPDLSEESKQVKMIWNLWSTAQRSLLYDDTHPGFVNGHWSRVAPQVPGWDVYSDGVYDAHIQTALYAIANQLGILN